jgi:hypothetical protein
VRTPKWTWLTGLPYVSRYLPRPPYDTTWKAERLAQSGRATVIFTGDHYERPSERTRATTAPPGFAVVRNGAVSVFVPGNTAATVEVQGADAKIASLPATPNPQFRVVARCREECTLRVRLDGRDVE